MLGDHIFAGERLQGFSDAVFAIIATIMAIPLRLERDTVEERGIENFDLRTYLFNQYPKYLIYIFSFIMVVDAWYSHTRVFTIVEQVDDVILWLNLLYLLFISFLPYGIGLVSEFVESRPSGFNLAITITSLDIIFIGVTMVIILTYAFRKQNLIHPEIADCKEIRPLKRVMYITLLINPLLAVFALGLSFLDIPVLSALFFYPIGTASFVVRVGYFIYHKYKNIVYPEHVAALFRTVASKTRTEMFSDGVFSIVATLIVLDLTTQGIPSVQVVEKTYNGSLKEALTEEKYIYLSFVASFVIVGLLWFVHYSIFQFIEKMTPALSAINTLILSLVCAIPFVTGVNVIFSSSHIERNNPNEITSIRVVSVVVFLAGLSQLAFWAAALLAKDQCLSEEVDKHRAEMLQFAKIMVLPAVSFVTFWATFSGQVTVHHVYTVLLFTTPFIFLILKVLFTWHTKFKRCSVDQLSGQERSLPLQSEERDSVIPLVSDEPVAGKKQTSEGGVYEAV